MTSYDDDFDTADAAYCEVSERVNDGDISMLCPEEQIIVLVWDAFGLIGIGGLRRYLSSSCSSELAAKAFESIGVRDVAVAIRTALNQFTNSSLPEDPEIREMAVQRFQADKPELFENLNRIIWQARDEIVRGTAEFVRSNRAVFKRTFTDN